MMKSIILTMLFLFGSKAQALQKGDNATYDQITFGKGREA